MRYLSVRKIYILIISLLLLQKMADGQRRLQGVYELQSSYFYTGLNFFKDDSCTYHIETELDGKSTFHSTYTVNKSHIHLNITPPPDTQKARIGFSNDNIENRTLKLLDCNGVTYVGANVVINKQLKYLLDGTSSITLPSGLVIETLEINYIGRPDTTLNISDSGKGNILAIIPTQYMLPTIYGFVVTDWYRKRTWLFGRQRLYAVRKGVVLSDYYLKRVK